MKIRNLVFATAGAATLALALSACSEPAANNSANNKPANLATPANTATPMNIATPSNTNTGNGNVNKPANLTNANMKNTNANASPTKKP